MIYRKFKDENLSAMGMGLMRLPKINDDDSVIDKDRAQEMVDYAYENGINYFDTAWGYHGGNSELFIGEALKKYSRDSFYLADKFPGYSLKNFGKTKEIFNKQLEKCQVDYFDFYLIHNVNEQNIKHYLDDEKYGTVSYINKQKNAGKIKHLGFSVHGTYETTKRFLEAYGELMEFCQIQLNYVDYEFQEAKRKIELCKEYNLGIWVMEPLRGGQLAKLNDEDMEILHKQNPKDPAIKWAYRWLQSNPEINIVLSGSSSLDQIKENISYFSEENPLNDAEMKAINTVAKNMIERNILPCTACRYCTQSCPVQLDIPRLLALYNEFTFTNGGFIAPMSIASLDESKRPSACIACGACKEVCPQNIDIPNALENFAKHVLESPFFER